MDFHRLSTTEVQLMLVTTPTHLLAIFIVKFMDPIGIDGGNDPAGLLEFMYFSIILGHAIHLPPAPFSFGSFKLELCFCLLKLFII